MEKNFEFSITVNAEQFFDYIKRAPMGYLIIDYEGYIVAINDIILKASNYNKAELVGSSFEKFFIFDGSKREFFQKIDSLVNSYYKISWRDSQNKEHYNTAFILKTHTKPDYYAIGFIEISNEENIQLITRFAQSFVLENNIGIILIDNKLNIVEISPLALKLFNVKRNDVINRSIDDVFYGVPDEHRIVQKALLDGITMTNHAVSWTINEHKYELLMDSNIIIDGYGNTVGAYVVFKDVSNLRSLEQQVRQNDRLATIGQIAAGTAHEIRNPLTSIKGFLQILRNTLNEKNLTNELNYTDIMLSEIERINKLVNEILLLSKPKDVVYKPVDVNKVLVEILPIIKNESLLRGIEVKYDLDVVLPLVIADSELLKQVFLNITKNGIEAMGFEGTMSITTKLNKETKCVEVFFHDTGPGIPNYIMDKIFDPFFTTKETGTGLGLSICQKIIHDLGGNIRLSTKGFGTTFQVMLPYI